jgi:thymidylate kinase
MSYKLRQKPLIIEFSGMPSAGKSTTIDILEHYFCRAGYDCFVIGESADLCPFSKKSRFEFASWTANHVLNVLLEQKLGNKFHDIVFIDRGIFDVQVFLQLACEDINMPNKEVITSYFALPHWQHLVDIVFFLDISVNTALYRHSTNRLSSLPGLVVNPQFIERLAICYKNLLNSYQAQHEGGTIECLDGNLLQPLQVAEICREKIEILLSDSNAY